VARIAVTLMSCLPDAALEMTAADIALAARTHEIGRLEGPTADPAEMAVHGATLLAEAGFPEIVVKAVRHLHERWDGTGGPDRLAGAQIPAGSLVLSAADSLDHYCSAWMQAGMKPLDAVDRAIGLVVVQQSTLFSPLVAGAVHRERAAIRAICTAERALDEPAGAIPAPTSGPSLRLA
jgi:response regulator RpfG family c-di-GMP phosphodiesterase